MVKENFHTFPKRGVKMFIITYDETNIDIYSLTVHSNGTRDCMYLILVQRGYNGKI